MNQPQGLEQVYNFKITGSHRTRKNKFNQFYNDKMKTNRTLQEIAEHFGTKVWKESRVYLPQFGYKTKKMNTTVYLYIVDGEIKVSVFIDCPSQPYAWINSQKKQVEDTVFIALAEMEEEAQERGGSVRVYGEGYHEVVVEQNIPATLEPVKAQPDAELVK